MPPPVRSHSSELTLWVTRRFPSYLHTTETTRHSSTTRFYFPGRRSTLHLPVFYLNHHYPLHPLPLLLVLATPLTSGRFHHRSHPMYWSAVLTIPTSDAHEPTTRSHLQGAIRLQYHSPILSYVFHHPYREPSLRARFVTMLCPHLTLLIHALTALCVVLCPWPLASTYTCRGHSIPFTFILPILLGLLFTWSFTLMTWSTCNGTAGVATGLGGGTDSLDRPALATSSP